MKKIKRMRPAQVEERKRWLSVSCSPGIAVTHVFGGVEFRTAETIEKLCFSPDGKAVYAEHENRWLRVDLATGAVTSASWHPELSVRATQQGICFHPTQDTLVRYGAGQSTTLQRAGMPSKKLAGVGCAAISRDGTLLFLVPPHTPDRIEYSVVSFATEEELFRVGTFANAFNPRAVLFSSDNKLVWIVSSKQLSCWNLSEGRITHAVSIEGLTVLQLHRSAHEDRFFVVRKTQCEERSMLDGALLRTHSILPGMFAIAPDGATAVLFRQGTFFLYDFATRQQDALCGYGYGPVEVLAVRDDEKLVATVREDVIEVFDASSGERIAVLDGEEIPHLLTFSRDGNTLFAVHDRELLRWNLAEESIVARVPLPAPAEAMVLTKDGDTIVLALNVHSLVSNGGRSSEDDWNALYRLYSFDARSLSLLPKTHNVELPSSSSAVIVTGTTASSYVVRDRQLEEREARSHALLRAEALYEAAPQWRYVCAASGPSMFVCARDEDGMETVFRWQHGRLRGTRLFDFGVEKLIAANDARSAAVSSGAVSHLFRFDALVESRQIDLSPARDSITTMLFAALDGVCWIGTKHGMVLRVVMQLEFLNAAKAQ